jgi:aminoglycoside phosphotransferase (APT) family kinase protein
VVATLSVVKRLPVDGRAGIDAGLVRRLVATQFPQWSDLPVTPVSSSNLLVRNGRLAAVIDFGTSGVGDPACDLVIAWTMFPGNSRDKFRSAVRQDAATWARARGWALWKALIGLTGNDDANRYSVLRREIDEIVTDHERTA